MQIILLQHYYNGHYGGLSNIIKILYLYFLLILIGYIY